MSMDSLKSLKEFLSFVRREQLHSTENGLLYYGSGEAAHWPVQSNLNVAAAFAVAGIADNNTSDIDIALKLFRYAFRTHLTGDMVCSCGKQWGCHWISVLGLERAAHAINGLSDYFTADDLARYRELRIKEAEFLLEYEVVASMSWGTPAKNKPESNAWNGGFLWRCALDYPEHEKAELWKQKGNKLLLNAISYITDAESEELYDGVPLKEWHIAPNFTPDYSLDHHGYMNIGYSFVTLSNIAMLHFNFKEKGQQAPKALYLHARDLWNTIKHFIFDDGRMLRVGGYNRTRYTYCQCYMVPVFLFAADCLGDADAMRLEENCMELIRREQLFNADGSYYSRRLEEVKKHSYYYYVRIESDPAVVLSQDVYWKNKFSFPSIQQGKQPDFVWYDDFHQAHLIKKDGVIRSFSPSANRFSGPIALCVPADRSDMAEWQGNLSCRYVMNRAGSTRLYSSGTHAQDSFTHNCGFEWYNDLPLGEGEEKYPIALSRSAVAALPDGRTMVVIERSEAIKEEVFESVMPLQFSMPNDLFNGGSRRYKGDGFDYTSQMLPGTETDIDTGCRKLTIDGRVTISALEENRTLHLIRPAGRTAHVVDKKTLTSLYIDYISPATKRNYCLSRKGDVFADTAVAVAVDAPEDFCADASFTREGMLRIVEITGADGIRYVFAANLGDTPAICRGREIAPQSSQLFSVKSVS